MSYTMVFVYIFSALVPLAIIFRSFRTLSKRIKKCRLFFAIPSILSLAYDLTLVYLILNEHIPYDEKNYFISIGPVALAVVSFLFYQIGTKKEQKLEADIHAENSIDIMDLRKANQPKTVDFKVQ